MPRSVYWPLRHMSHSPTAQFGQGRIGPAHDPNDKVPFFSPLGPGSMTRGPSDSWPSVSRCFAGRRPTVLPFGNLDVGAADANGHCLDEHGAVRMSGSGILLGGRNRVASVRQ